MELEHLLAGQNAGVAGGQRLEPLHALVDRAQEAARLVVHGLPDQRLALAQLRVGAPHRLDDAGDPVGERPAKLEPAGMEGGAPDQPAEDVAAPLGAGEDAVGDQEGHPPQVVGNQPLGAQQADLGVLVDEADEGREEVDLVDAVDALEDRGDAVEAHPGVDPRPGQRWQRAVPLAVELHEDQVPELEDALAVIGVAARLPAADVGPPVPPELGVRPAGARLARRPPVLLVAVHPFRVDVGEALPEPVGLVVGRVDGDPKPVLGQPEDLGDELPGERDGTLLEVVAGGREVAQHLEEGGVAVVADLLDVLGPEGFLAGGEPGRGRPAHALEIGLERLHAGRDQECRRVPLRYQGGAGQDEVIAAGKELEKTRSGFVPGHAVIAPPV